jgi:hypothetical protein
MLDVDRDEDGMDRDMRMKLMILVESGWVRVWAK